MSLDSLLTKAAAAAVEPPSAVLPGFTLDADLAREYRLNSGNPQVQALIVQVQLLRNSAGLARGESELKLLLEALLALIQKSQVGPAAGGAIHLLGKGVIMAFQLPDDRPARAVLDLTDLLGAHGAKPSGVPTWSVDNPNNCTLTVDDDGMGATVQSTNGLPFQLQAHVPAQDAQGNDKSFVLLGDVQPVAGNAVGGQIVLTVE